MGRPRRFNLTVKGQELPMHEPRLKQVLGLGYAVAPVGADHMMNMHDTDFTSEGDCLQRVNALLQPPVGPLRPNDLGEDKLQVFYHELNWMHFQDCAVNCHFYPYDYDHLATAISGVTGVEYSLRDILAVGARAQTLARLFNLREGFTADDDRLPKRVMKAFSKRAAGRHGGQCEALHLGQAPLLRAHALGPRHGRARAACVASWGSTNRSTRPAAARAL